MAGINAYFRLDWPGFSLDVELALPGRGVTALFGHSGSGKTTLLRCIAGLEHAPHGRLGVDGEVWQDTGRWVPTHQRSLGYVFQEASLFPHLTVMDNLRYGMKRAGGAPRVSLVQTIELLGIGHLLDRKPDRLSGGERQRVAIARALALSPRLLLMDEPLAALDLKRKHEILPYLERLHDELEIPILYVSHSLDEVARLADHLVLLESGRVSFQGGLVEGMTRLDLPLAQGDTAATVLEAIVISQDAGLHLTRVACGATEMELAGLHGQPGAPVRVRIAARDVSLALVMPVQTSILNLLPANIVEVSEEAPGQMLVKLEMDGQPLLSRITRKSARALGLAPGMRVIAQVKSIAVA